MALTDEGGSNGFYMPVAPAYGGGYGNQGNGFFGGDWAWILLLLLIGGGGWGMGGFGMGGMMWPMMMGGFGGGFGLDYLYPWLNNSQHISDGFRDQYLNTQIGDLRTDVNRGFGDVQLGIAGVNQNICQTGNAITGAINNGFSSAEIAANGRQMANMQQIFGVQSALQQCCCDNRLATESLRATVLSENCADRYEAANNTRDIITAITSGIQSVKDELCADRLEGYKRENDNLRTQLNMASLSASQIAQTAQIRDGQNAAVNALVNELRSCPIPAQPVYGNQPIFQCSGPAWNNTGCGCGCGCNGGNF